MKWVFQKMSNNFGYDKWRKKKKPIYLYDMKDQLIEEFETTDEFAEFCGKETSYIYHNLKYCKKMRINKGWFKIRREKI